MGFLVSCAALVKNLLDVVFLRCLIAKRCVDLDFLQVYRVVDLSDSVLL